MYNSIINSLTYSSFLRSLEIDLALDNPNKIIDFFNGIWDGLSVIEENVYHTNGGELIYYKLEDDGKKEWIFYWDNKNDKFKCNYYQYWIYFKSIFNLNYVEIEVLTRLLVENVLKCSVATSVQSMEMRLILVENALNYSIETPILVKI